MRSSLRTTTSRGTSIAVAAVAFIAGILFATSASVFAGLDDGRPRDLRGLVAEESERLTVLNETVEELRGEVTMMESSVPGVTPEDEVDPRLAVDVGLEPVAGEGVTVTLTDAPATSTSENLDDLVVHQQDLQAVVNAMWAGGADAVAIQGQRLVATSAVRCVGNVLLLHGRTYSPPYVVEAIGETESLTDAVESDPGVRLFQQYVDAFGLGFELAQEDDLVLPAYTGTRSLVYATAAEENR